MRHAYYALDNPELTLNLTACSLSFSNSRQQTPELVTEDSHTSASVATSRTVLSLSFSAARMYSMDDAMNLEELDAWLSRTDELWRTLTNPVVLPASLRLTGLGKLYHGRDDRL